MKELENIWDHASYLHSVIPRSKWTRDDQWIAHLSTKIEAVLALHEFDSDDVACGNPRHTNFDVGCPDCYHPCQGCGESYPCSTVKVIQGAIHDPRQRHPMGFRREEP